MSVRARWTVTAVLVLAGVAGCGTASSQPSAGSVTVKDCQGKDITFAAVPARAVTIDGWAAQVMARLGLADRIVGTGFAGPVRAEQEPFRGQLATVPVITDKIPSTESVAALAPDVVLTGFPDFGGPPGTPTEADLAAMKAPGVAACVNTKAGPMTDLSAMYDYLARVGRVFQVADRADQVIRELKAREDTVRAKAGPRTRVLALADNPVVGQPVKALGGATPVNALIHLAGGVNVFDEVPSMHADVSPEKIAALDPQVIWVVTDLSFAKATGRELVDQISANPLLATTSAVRDRRILSTSQYVVGFPTPLTIDGLEQIAAGLRG
ncbi:ABC transporter substrate-binding protein [Actinocrispum wychmicini]|uniref:Iron complex transport system substrate-binding protein n=1 Tax=Actinocrispum wychmicini TaxID=1213861 RepID=A0A4V2S7R8_9PSEU|nr:ABC transporter substrate-binding protein [Actinocrispum wychmicini]TCO60600.1 iron complex transport system substrate-binding protein [Actinocrispum wychmicini]